MDIYDVKEQVDRLLQKVEGIKLDPFSKEAKQLTQVKSILEIWKDDLVIQERRLTEELEAQLTDEEMEWLRVNAPAIWVQKND